MQGAIYKKQHLEINPLLLSVIISATREALDQEFLFESVTTLYYQTICSTAVRHVMEDQICQDTHNILLLLLTF